MKYKDFCRRALALMICCTMLVIPGKAEAASATCSGRSWSAWTTNAPIASASLQVESKTQYSYRDLSWTKSGSGTIDYAASWPSGFNKNSSLYTKYNKTPVKASETSTAKVEVATGRIGFIYWHWCMGRTDLEKTYNRKISTNQTSTYKTFHAFYSTNDVPVTTSAAGTPRKIDMYKKGCNDTYWWLKERVEIYRCTYTNYDRTYSEWSSWQDSAVTASSSREVKTRKVYRSRSTAHTWNGGVVTKAATCTADGVRTYTCTSCGQTKTSAIAKLGHSFAAAYTVDKAATCTAAGSQSQHCIRCGAMQNVKLIPAKGHTWDGGAVTRAATTASEGVRTFTCTTCRATRTEAIPKVELLKQTITAKNVTLTRSGKKRTKKLNIQVNGGAKVSCSVSNKKLKVSGTSVVIPKNFVGTGKIVIKAAATAQYAGAKKTITLKVLPPTTALNGLRENLDTQMYRLSWKKISGVSGYEIQMSTDRKFKKGVVKKKGSSLSATFSYKTGKMYYFRVRTYKKVSGKFFYSKWSKIRTKKS